MQLRFLFLIYRKLLTKESNLLISKNTFSPPSSGVEAECFLYKEIFPGNSEAKAFLLSHISNSSEQCCSPKKQNIYSI